MVSFSRKKRGGLGDTINSFCVTTFSVNLPETPFFVCPNNCTFQRVKASGVSNSKLITPFEFVFKYG